MEGAFHQLDRIMRAALPVLVCVFFLMLMLVPWPWPEIRQLLSMLVLMALCVWVVHAPDYFSMRWSFIIGFLQDVLLAQPLGVSALLYLCIDFFLRTQRVFFLQQSFRHFWMVFSAIVITVSLLQWGLAALFLGQVRPLLGVVINSITAIFLFPLIALVLHGIQRVFLARL